MKIGFQGEHGAYSELAVVKHFGKDVEAVPCEAFSRVFDLVKKKECDYGMIPIENSIHGSVGENYDLLNRFDLKIKNEVFIRIQHCLISYSGTKLEDIKKVYSHPQALGQCKKFLEGHGIKMISTYDTAGSVKIIKKHGKKDEAAIASELAASLYDMNIVCKGIETNKHNFTRFFVIGHKDSKKTGKDKTSVIFTAKHEPGSLYKSLKGFADRDINLTKLESRPIIGKPWEYMFHADFEGHKTDNIVCDALENMETKTIFLKILGSYPQVDHNAI